MCEIILKFNQNINNCFAKLAVVLAIFLVSTAGRINLAWCDIERIENIKVIGSQRIDPETVVSYSKLKIALNERQQQIVAHVKENESVQIKGIQSVLENYSRNTIKKDLAYLVNEGILLKVGAGRGVRYYIKGISKNSKFLL